MNSGDEKTSVTDNDAAAQLSLELELAPAWAKTTPEAYQRRYADDERGGREETRRFGGGRDSPRDRDGGGRDRRPGGPRPGGLGRGGPGGPGAPNRGGPRPDFRRSDDRRGGDRRPDDRRGDDRRSDYRPAREELPPPLPLDIRILPDQKALGAVIRRIQTTHRAYPLRDIARLFLDNPAAHQFRIEPLKGENVPLFQCRVCGLPALSEEEVRAHVLAVHLEDFFEVSDIETDPPAGNFVCVARCGLSGELLGPPNHHSFNARVQEMLRTRYASMSEVEYRSRVVMVREPEAVNQWRESCRKKKVYRRKQPQSAEVDRQEGAGEAQPSAGAAAAGDTPAAAAAPDVVASPALERQAAELQFMREILPTQIMAVKHLVAPATAARQTPSRRLEFALREAMNREEKFPASLFFALRGAFRHRTLHLFRANHERGLDFVVVHAPVPLDATHVVAELRDVLDYINEHPGCTRQELLDTVSAGDVVRAARLITQLNTLVEKAHVIEFFNGVLAPPAEHPVFKPQPAPPAPRKAESPKPAAKPAPQPTPAAADTAVSAEAPAVVEPAAVEPVPVPSAPEVPEAAPAAPEQPAP